MLALVLIIQTPMVQTYIAQKVMKNLSDNIDGEVTVEKIHFKPFSNLVIKDIIITDKNPAADKADSTRAVVDTFFKAEYIIANLSLKGLRNYEGIHLDNVTIKNGEMHLVLEDGETPEARRINNISRIFGLKARPDKEVNDKELFLIRKVRLEGFRFTLKNHATRKHTYRGGINWDDLDCYDINLSARKIQYKGDVMYGTLTELSFKEKTGFVCNGISGKAKVGNGMALLTDMTISDDLTDISLPSFSMTYENSRVFADYNNQVTMNAEIADCHVDFRTLAYFAPQFEGMTLALDIHGGGFSGTVNDFTVNDVEFTTPDKLISGTIDGNLSNITDIKNSRLGAHVHGLKADPKGINTLISHVMPETDMDISQFIPDERFTISLDAEGGINALDINASINSEIGKLEGELAVKELLNKDKPISISGTIDSKDLQMGMFIGTDLIGETTLTADIDGTLGSDDKASSLTINKLNVEKLNIHGYDYSEINGEGTISNNAFDGRITCEDPNLSFMFHGKFGLSRKTNDALYQFYAIIGHADLNALNIDKRGKSKIAARTRADFRRTRRGDFYGDIDLDRISVENEDGLKEISNIKLTSVNRNETYRINLRSDFLNGSYTGTAPVTEFIKDLGNITFKRELPALFDNAEYKWNGNRYSIDFNFGNTSDLLSYAVPGLYIADNTTISARINDHGRLNASLNSQLIAFRRQYAKNIGVSFNNNDDSINGQISCNEIQVASLKLSDNDITILADDNHIGAGYTYNNRGELENRGEFFVHGDLQRESGDISLDMKILPSVVHLNSQQWRIEPSHIKLSEDEINITSAEIVNNDQRIRLHGKTSAEKKDTLTLSLDRFNLGAVNHLIGQEFGISGKATGTVRITSPMKSKGILVDMICDSTSIAGKPVGTLNVGSSWDEMFNLFNITANNDLDGKSTLDLTGKYTPKIRNIDATVKLDSLQAGYLQPILEGTFENVSGFISGEIGIEGPIDDFSITSNETRLDDGRLTVEYTKVPYIVDGNFHIDDSGIHFDNMKGRDRYTGTATINGGILWNGLKDLSMNTYISCDEMEGINLTEEQNEYFYGNAFGTGNVSITGPMSSIEMNVDVVTAKHGNLHIPVSAASKTGSSNMLKFTEKKEDVKIDPYEAMILSLSQKEEKEAEFISNLHINTTTDVDAYIEIDKAAGHVLKGNGNGKIEIRTSDDMFDITGDYTLTNGSYRFVALGMVNRDFSIQDGSSITFNGDILESDLNIDAMYSTKVSLSTLIADTTSVTTRRTVDCGINITGKLRNPRLAFSIDIPELDPTIESKVRSALSTEDKVQKQFLSLLLSNSFVPDEQAGIFNNSALLYSNVSEIMAGQLNNILQKFNIPVDLGLNYQPNEKGNDVFDVAVSTQMFNNRVVVNGSVGNKQYTSGTGQSDVVGDLDIEVKLNRSGALRLTVFSHSADSYTNYLDNSQRNGVGIMYQTEFNSLKQFFINMFSGKKKRQEAKKEEEQTIINGERVRINITE